MQSPPGARVLVDGVEYDYFGGTGYLGLQGHPEVIAAASAAAQQYGIHTATSRSRFVSPTVLEVEAQAAQFFGTESAWYLVSGYVGNAILVHLLRPRVDAVFVDADAHFSVLEAAAAAGAPVHAFANRSADALENELQRVLAPGQRPLVMTDGVFPSFGWIAPLDRYVRVLADYPGAALLVDDAHAYGVLGANGRGTFEHFGLGASVNTASEKDPTDGVSLFSVGTLSKALGGYGGIFAGNAALVAEAKAASGYYDGATALPAPVAAATARAIELSIATPGMRQSLSANVQRLRSGLRELHIDNEDLPTPIIGFSLPTADAMRRLQQDLKDAGILVPYAPAYPGIGAQGAMRIAVFATHTVEMIDRLLDALRQLLPDTDR